MLRLGKWSTVIENGLIGLFCLAKKFVLYPEDNNELLLKGF